jgi:branched-chain amino acid transport system substrate-binding protein
MKAAVVLVALALVGAACGASPRVEREVAARNAALARNANATGASASADATNTGLSSADGASGAVSGQTATAGPVAATAGSQKVGATANKASAAAPAGGNGGATDVGITATTVKIGGTFFNGNYLDKYSQVSEQAAKAYFRYVNDQGGVYGRKIDFVACDTAGTAQGTNGCLTKLARQDRVFIMGPSLDFNLDTVQQTLAGEKLPWVGSSGLYGEEFSSPWMFPSQQPGFDVGALIATFSVQKLGAKTIGISYLNSVAGPACRDRAKAVAQKLGATDIKDVGNEESSPSLSAQVQQMKDANPDAVLFCNDPINTVKFIQGSNGYKPPKGFVGGFVAADDVAQAFGPNGIGAYGFTGFDFYKDNTPDVKRFRDITEFYYPAIFHHFYSQAAYTGAVAIVEAMKKAGPQLTRDKFLVALKSLTAFESMGLTFNFARLSGGKSSGIMLQVDSANHWKVVSERFASPQ